jgi:anti-sigma factor RsiW
VERCIQPGAVTEDDLVAYAYGEADPAVARHVRTCPACAAAAAEYERLQHHLGGLLYRVECPPAETLAEFQLRLLPAIEQARVAAHVRACPRCAAEVATLGEDLAAEPPPSDLGERLRRAVVTLLAPAPHGALAGVRSTGGPSACTYHAGDLTLTLHLEATARRAVFNLTGQIWQEDAGAAALAGQAVRLIAPEGNAVTAAIGDLGDFFIDAVAAGVYRLEIELPDRVVVVEALRIAN